MTVIYGIPNCSSVKKARQQLENAGIAYRFVNFKTELPDAAQLRDWLNHFGRDVFINKKGTTWRQLTDSEKQMAENDDTAIALVQRHPSLIKRPILEHENEREIGFDAQRYATLFPEKS